MIGPIVLGEKDHVFRTKPLIPDDATLVSSNWSGYINVFRLTADRKLILVGYEVGGDTFDGDVDFQPVGEGVRGDFWLTISGSRTRSLGLSRNCTYIPFCDGNMELERSKWRTISGGSSEVELLFRRPGMYTAYGTMPEILAFLNGWLRASEHPTALRTPRAEVTGQAAPSDAVRVVEWIADLADVNPIQFSSSGAVGKLRRKFSDDVAFRRAALHLLYGWPAADA